MYDESTDFAHHALEVQRYLDCCSPLGLQPSKDALCLDFGAGNGMHAGFLSAHFGQVWAADIIDYSSLYSGEFLKLIREKHERNGAPFEAERIRFVNTDGMDLIFREGLFDSVVSFNVFEHVPDPVRALNEILRVLKPGGHAYITFDPIWTCDTGSHYAHLITEPWAHLLLSDDEYCNKMKALGATEAQCGEYRYAMNRVRLAQHIAAFDAVVIDGKARLLSHNRWSGTEKPGSPRHQNFAQARARGYSEEELLARGLCYVIAKPAAVERA
jgi:ubiquinone/menaquinone biosynthesis C-methylase UbiE